MTILAEDLLLLLLDDETGKLRVSNQIGVALGAAVLADLAILGNVTAPASSGPLRRRTVQAVGVAPAHALLAEKLAVVAEKPRTAQDLVSRLGKGLKERITAELVSRGVLGEQTRRALGLFPRTTWPAADLAHEAELTEAMAATIATGQLVEPRARALVAILSALGAVDQIVGVQAMSTKEVRRRAKDLERADWVAQGVRSCIATTNAALATPIVT